ncbi:hypothetical protein DYB32_004339 [Aphanomyces invadans]|uniref:Fibronectin type-III domain-containing protein n=1 Tax=Aphanomyces invadans TaxID=157072 RepID=A0A3R6WMJ7_9STRA|nr:hypothetical protein DYB32_004339 [Aphanomyces invadans]
MKLIGVLPAHHGGVSWCGFAGRYLYTCSALDYLIKRWDVAAWLHAQESDALSTGNSGDPSNKDDASDRTALTGHSSAAHDVTPTAAHAPTPNDTRATPFTPSSAKIVPSTLETPSQLEPSKLLDWTARQKYNRALDALFSPDVTLQTLTVGHHLPQFCLNDDWTHNRHRDSSDFDLLLPPLFPCRSSDDGATEGLREADDDPVKLAQLESIDILTLLDPSSSIRHPLCNERVTFHANDIFLDDAAVVEFQKRSAQGVHVSSGCRTYQVRHALTVTLLQFWNAACGTHMHTIRNAHDRDILTCALSAHPTTAYLATGSSDSFVKIWNPSTFECVFTLRGHYDSVLSVSFTPTGHCVYSSGRDAQVIKWQVIPTGAESHLCLASLCCVEPDVPAQPVVVPTTPVETVAYRPSTIKKPCRVSDVGTRSVVLEWFVPSANGARISHYHVRCIPEDPLHIDATVDVTSMRVRLQASNVIDKKVLDSPFSPWSDIVATLPSVPAAPAMPVLTAATSHTLTMTFHAPCDNGYTESFSECIHSTWLHDGRQPILRYYVMVFVDDDSYGVVSRRFVEQIVWPVDALPMHGAIGLYEMNLVGLRGTKRYVVSISAENALGKGDFSPVSHALATKPAIVPDVVPVDLEWTVPSHDGGSPLIAYSIDYSTNDGPFESEFKLHRMDTRLTLDFLKPKTTYSFRVAAVNAAGMATYSTPTAKTVTPSLVEHTLRQYFLHRPAEEHNAATSIQVQPAPAFETNVIESGAHVEAISMVENNNARARGVCEVHAAQSRQLELVVTLKGRRRSWSLAGV